MENWPPGYPYLVNPNNEITRFSSELTKAEVEKISYELQSAPNVKRFGARGNGVVLEGTVKTTANSTTITCTEGKWNAEDVGKLIAITDTESTKALGTTIASVISATEITVTTAPTWTLAKGNVTYGSDDTEAIKEAFIATAGGALEFPKGVFCVKLALVQPGATIVRGCGAAYPDIRYPLGAGSVISLCASVAGFFYTMGSGEEAVPKNSEPETVLMEMGIECNNLIGTTATRANVRTKARRCRIMNCTVWHGANYAFSAAGQNTRVINCTFGQQNTESVVRALGSDFKMIGGEVRQGGNAGGTGHQMVIEAEDASVMGTHLYSGANGTIASTSAGADIAILGTANKVNLTGITFDGTYGPQLLVEPSEGSTIRSVAVTGSKFFQVTGFPNEQFPAIRLAGGAASTIRDISITGNVTHVTGASQYTALVEKTSTGTLQNISVAGNSGQGCLEIFKGFLPDGSRVGNAFTNKAGTNLYSERRGVAKLSGTGLTLELSFPHGLGAIPTAISITPMNAVAGVAAFAYATASATEITVHFVAAPVAGVENVVLAWEARL